ncbi:Hint domain-containing protein [Rhodopseudomonas palustris]|uniref:Hint domain-containing protein n=1 Tax=Rhodopseudomonas palustris TaxID=1076 RepID=UPI000E5A267A|nr:Hint domain-containing protein [Rhodopseudomonas palustris]QLH71670.1 Hint domain-containing protein [Rhodopseudomonas palustris]RHZ94880.1 hypothetical protein D1920_19725 [Rhodopseudomonas palustris]
MMVIGTPKVQSISWGAPTGAVNRSGVSFLNEGDSVSITYKFDRNVSSLFHPGSNAEYIVLNNGEKAFVSEVHGNQVKFSYTVKPSDDIVGLGLIGPTGTEIFGHGGQHLSFNYSGHAVSAPKGLEIVDTAPPTITIDTIAGDDVLSRVEARHGLRISGTTTAENGQTVVVRVVDESNNKVIEKISGTVSNGKWEVDLSRYDALRLSDPTYRVTAEVADFAGNKSADARYFTSTICFMAGTRIQTVDGQVMVETLKRGDTVVCADGRVRTVNWLGRQTVSTVFANSVRVLPIRIMAGAISDGVPSRDLLISPDHALLIDGILIHAGALVNGTSVVRETDVPRTFMYYHVEVSDHSLILAEGTPAETFVDNVDRLAFDNWAEHEALYPGGLTLSEMPYPRAKSHRQVPVRTRVRLAERARLIGVRPDQLAVG